MKKQVGASSYTISRDTTHFSGGGSKGVPGIFVAGVVVLRRATTQTKDGQPGVL